MPEANVQLALARFFRMSLDAGGMVVPADFAFVGFCLCRRLRREEDGER
jgi:hypothetical protein